jgi:hypothetical protein
MKTSDERREVAENLRNLTIRRHIQYKEQFFDELAEVVVGFEDYHDFDVVLEKLADFIDPTCHKVIPSEIEGYVFCSKCGAEIGEYGVPNYCHNCGARVVSGDATD